MILLVTLNSTYQHSSFGLRYLKANMKELESQTKILEPTIQVNPKNLVEKIVKSNPTIVGFGVYIWNSQQTYEVVSILKKVAPHIYVILGGPEISYETEDQPLAKICDYIIKGEADFLFYQLCKKILANELPENKIFSAQLPDIESIRLPYYLYTDEDIKNRIIYVEASRGCPYKCEYCLSSLDKSVRSFDLDLFLAELDQLIQRGARNFKFVDRTFNLNINFSTKILNFFLSKIDLELFLHFEMVPDRLPDELKLIIQKFPKGALQFEVGIQTLNPEVAQNVSRKNNLEKVQSNFEFLLNSGVHTHADLIVGLPGETIESFAEGFDRLSFWQPDEIQVGILKRLKGTPIIRHDQKFKMIYHNHPPFQILQNSTMSFSEIQKMVRFAKYWDLFANSGNFRNCMTYFKNLSGSLFWNFMRFVDFLSDRHEDQHSISLQNLTEDFYDYLLNNLQVEESQARKLVIQDYCQGPKKRDLPRFLKNDEGPIESPIKSNSLKLRQEKHQYNKN
jgi:radical SAM superfamily enzyme YgiQ (UPF0313 family)